jgi:hypothetical protein
MLSETCKHSPKPHTVLSVRLMNIIALGIVALVWTMIFVIVSNINAMACSCSKTTICDLIHAPILFVGEVIDGGITSIRQDPWYFSSGLVRFRIVEYFRGVSKNQETVDINISQIPGMCSPNPYHFGRRYLVAPNKVEGELYDGPCFNGRDVETYAEDVRKVRQAFSRTVSINVYGQVAATHYSDKEDMVDYLLRQGEAKPMAGVLISASMKGRTYSTETNADGRYALTLPNTGTYEISASLQPYSSEPTEISFSGNGCAIHDFGLKIDNTISGRVLDESGKPMKDMQVGLIDLDRPPSKSGRHAWFARAYTNNPNMSYTFKNVPIGRYLLLSNPDGPHPGKLAYLSLESTLYPLNSSRANALPIEVKSSGVHLTGIDLIAGKSVEFRRVSVRVVFPDGMKMKTAEVVCTGLPLQEGDIPWIDRAYATLSNAADGSIEFLAPANRKLQLEVRDDYGRNLKGVYTSLHEAGVTPITQEFIVTP